jgi:hypothetical protein
MENNNEIINQVQQEPVVPIKFKKPRSEAMRESKRKYYFEKLKNNPEYQEKQRISSRTHYNKHTEEVKERVRNYSNQKKQIEMIERLYEVQQEKKINCDDEFNHINELMINKLARMELKIE